MKTGPVLEGGGVRGIFTAGVLDTFMEYDISFDGVIGVSAGAAYDMGRKCALDHMEDLKRFMKNRMEI